MQIFREDLIRVIGNLRKIVLNDFIDFYAFLIIIYTLFAIILFIFPFTGKHKLGGRDAVAKISFFHWACKIFCTGIGANFIHLAYQEPFYFYEFPYFKGHTDLERGIAASIFHRGVNMWIFYCIAALPLAYYYHTKKLPLLPRTYFYPLLKDKIYGIYGNIIDIIVAIAVFFAIANYFELMANSATDIVQGSIGSTYTTVIQIFVIILMCILFVALFRRGRKEETSRLAKIIVITMTMTLCFYAFVGPTMNIVINYISASVINVKYATTTLTNLKIYHEVFPTLISEKTIYNYAFWCTSSMCFGIYFAKISYGRTIREFILGSLVLPVIYVGLTYSIFGTLGSEVLINSDYISVDFFANIESGLVMVNEYFMESDIISIIIIGLALFMSVGLIFSEMTGSLISANYIISGEDMKDNKKVIFTFSLVMGLIILIYFSNVKGEGNIADTLLIYSIVIGSVMLIALVLFLYQTIQDVLYYNIYLPKLGYKEREIKREKIFMLENEKNDDEVCKTDACKDIDDIIFKESDNILNIDTEQRKKEKHKLV